MELTERQKAIILGAILGDASMENRWKNPRIKSAQGKNQKDYLFWKYQELRSITSSVPRFIRELDKRNGNVYESWHFATKADPELMNYWEIFYPNGKKVIPNNISEMFVNPLSLAVWFMDDGYKRNDCNAFRLNTDAFTFTEQRLLQTVLNRNFSIQTALHKKGKAWNIYIPETSADRFVEIVRPYIIPSMSYKITLAPVTTGVPLNGTKIVSNFDTIIR